ncbi:peptidase C14 [Streptomyces sp. CB04723]|uniref:peptidase C14 n=1 Tax=Streptomyces TaxID=1883 RepID=UPI0015C4CED7|nr:peptidase C14 [Streptomyces sp. CB04723]QLG33033.1 peptidase C14 [Streptomyces sp. CB04723]
MDTKAIVRTRKVLTAGRWFLITGLVFYSLMTTTPFVSAHSEWAWSGWVLGLIVDAAFIMALSAEGTLAKYGVTRLGGWPIAFRWVTGLSSVFLNVWLSVSAHDWVGVAVHLIAPALVMLLAEVGPVYMKALADAERDAGLPYVGPVKFTPLSAPEPSDPEDAPESNAPELGREAVFNHQVLDMPEPEPEPAPEPANVHGARLPNKEANRIIEEGWRHKLDAVEVAAAAGRHPATVRKKFAQLDAELTV